MTIVGFIASNVLVDTFWLRYKENPTRLKVDSFYKPLNMLDLPAITICQVKHVDEERALNFIDQLLVWNGKRRVLWLSFDLGGEAFGLASNIYFWW